MSFNNFLNNRTENNADSIILDSMENRNAEDYFFNKSDLNKMAHFKVLMSKYKLCNKVYYYFDESSKLWKAESSEDSLINRILEHVSYILVPEKQFISTMLNNKYNEYDKKKKEGTLTTTEADKMDELKQALKEFNKFMDKCIKDHQKVKFAKSVISLFNHNISDEEFINKININNQHLLPLKYQNLNLMTGLMEERTKEQCFTKSLPFFDLNHISKNDEAYQKVDKFFLDIATGSEIKKDYIQKILGYFLTGNVSYGRCFYIMYGEGKNGKSAIFEIIGEIFKHYCKAMDSSIIIKKGVKNTGQASPEIETLDYGLRLSLLSETNDGDKLNENLIKQITGNDSISYRPLYGKQKEFKTEAKLCMLTNNKPFFKLSTSMVDRIRFLNFGSRFGDHEKTENDPACYYKADPQLVQDLKTVYLEYVLAWILEGSKKFYKDKHMNLPDDPELKKENMSYINEMDSYRRFMEEMTETNEDFRSTCNSINEAYKKFCSDEGIPPMKPSELKKMILTEFKMLKNSTNYYCGFRIKQEEDIDE